MKKTYYEVVIEITFGDYSFGEIRRVGTDKEEFDKDEFVQQLKNFLYPNAISIEVLDLALAQNQILDKHPINQQ